MIIRYSARATRDLESIYEYLSQRSPQAALSVLAAIYAAVEFVRRHPEAAELININGIRMKVVHRYRFKIFYAANNSEDAVEIVHVRHTSRRPWSGGND